MLPLSAEIQSGRRDKPDGQTRTSHGCVRTTWLPPVSSHLASAGAGPERYAAVVNPPVGGKREIQKLLHVPSPKTRQNLNFGSQAASDLAIYGPHVCDGRRRRLCYGRARES